MKMVEEKAEDDSNEGTQRGQIDHHDCSRKIERQTASFPLILLLAVPRGSELLADLEREQRRMPLQSFHPFHHFHHFDHFHQMDAPAHSKTANASRRKLSI